MFSNEDAFGIRTLFSTGRDMCLVVQNHTEEAIIDRQPSTFVFKKAKLLELAHEMADPGPGYAGHLCQAFLIDSGKYSFRSRLPAIMSQQ